MTRIVILACLLALFIVFWAIRKWWIKTKPGRMAKAAEKELRKKPELDEEIKNIVKEVIENNKK